MTPQTTWRPYPFTGHAPHVSNGDRLIRLLSKEPITKVEIMQSLGITDNFYLNTLLKRVGADVVGERKARNGQKIKVFGLKDV